MKPFSLAGIARAAKTLANCCPTPAPVKIIYWILPATDDAPPRLLVTPPLGLFDAPWNVQRLMPGYEGPTQIWWTQEQVDATKHAKITETGPAATGQVLWTQSTAGLALPPPPYEKFWPSSVIAWTQLKRMAARQLSLDDPCAQPLVHLSSHFAWRQTRSQISMVSAQGFALFMFEKIQPSLGHGVWIRPEMLALIDPAKSIRAFSDGKKLWVLEDEVYVFCFPIQPALPHDPQYPSWGSTKLHQLDASFAGALSEMKPKKPAALIDTVRVLGNWTADKEGVGVAFPGCGELTTSPGNFAILDARRLKGFGPAGPEGALELAYRAPSAPVDFGAVDWLEAEHFTYVRAAEIIWPLLP